MEMLQGFPTLNSRGSWADFSSREGNWPDPKVPPEALNPEPSGDRTDVRRLSVSGCKYEFDGT